MSSQCMSLEELMNWNPPREKEKDPLPVWLRTKPRTAKQKKQALAYCHDRGIPTNPPPWEKPSV